MSREETIAYYKEEGRLSVKEIKEGILLVDKPPGITSYDVIRILKSRYPGVKIGHAGTLDPFASGLMIVALGSRTKELGEYLKLDKKYIATVTLGERTDTGDRDGAVVEVMPVQEFLKDQIEEALASLSGEHEYIVPPYSALKHEGRPLYSYARAGIHIEKKRIMNVRDAKLLGYEPPRVKVLFDVASGTYIRTLGEALGKKLGTVAHVSDLRRISIGDYEL